MDRGFDAGSLSGPEPQRADSAAQASRPDRVVVLTGGQDGPVAPTESTCRQGSAATIAHGQGGRSRGRAESVAADPCATSHLLAEADSWADWARPQLLDAVAVAREAEAGSASRHLAATLYQQWFYRPLGRPGEFGRAGRPLAGQFRAAHAGSGRRLRSEGYDVLRRHDVIGRDGWWRTWGEQWTPPRRRTGSVRLLISPLPGRGTTVVRTLTEALLDARHSWLLACATDPRRARRAGSMVLDLPSIDVLGPRLLGRLEPLLRHTAPPLCLPVVPGLAVAEFPDNGMSFGEHRCHLIALALRHPSSHLRPLRAIAAVFAAHGIDPAQPHRLR